MKKIALTLVILVTLGLSLYSDPMPYGFKAKLEGSWENQLGSTMVIQSVNLTTGAITGYYISPSGTTGQRFPLVGWRNYMAPEPGGNNVLVVCFSVRWNNGNSNYGSVATWNGYLTLDNSTSQNPPKIVGHWLLIRSNSIYIWDHIHTGQDFFHKVNQ